MKLVLLTILLGLGNLLFAHQHGTQEGGAFTGGLTPQRASEIIKDLFSDRFEDITQSNIPPYTPPQPDDEYWMKILIDTQIRVMGPCTFKAFAGMMVNKSSGQILCFGFNDTPNDPSAHGEMQTLRNCTTLFPGRGFDSVFWSSLTAYTTANPCTMCSTAFRWAKIGRVVYGSSGAVLEKANWPDTMIREWMTSYIATDSLANDHPTRYTGGILKNITDKFYLWQFDPNGPCPPTCKRDPGNSLNCIPI